MVWGLYYFLFWVLLLDIINYAGASLSAVLACVVTLANRSWLSIQFAHTGGSVSPSSNFLGQTNNPLKAELLPCWWWQWSGCGAASSVHTLYTDTRTIDHKNTPPSPDTCIHTYCKASGSPSQQYHPAHSQHQSGVVAIQIILIILIISSFRYTGLLVITPSCSWIF